MLDNTMNVNGTQVILNNVQALSNNIQLIRNQLSNTQIQQRQLQSHYRDMLSRRLLISRLSDSGFRVYSQTDEDGILHYIFSVIGTANKVCLDIAFGSPYGANTTNLIVNDGWHGILVCGDEKEAKSAMQFFSSHPDTHIYPPKIYSQWITAENINQVVSHGLMDSHIQGNEIDLFSLDIDGVDFWTWNALTAVVPRVVVVEYQDIWGEKSVTVPYRPDFNRFDTHPDYFGASLPAFVKLASAKGYRLVGCNKYGYNAFFVRNGIGEEVLPEVSCKECLQHPKVCEGQRKRLPEVAEFEWVKV